MVMEIEEVFEAKSVCSAQKRSACEKRFSFRSGSSGTASMHRGLEVGGAVQPLQRFRGRRRLDLRALHSFGQRRLHPGARGVEDRAVGIVQHRVVTGERREIRDPPPHRAASDHRDLTDHAGGLYPSRICGRRLRCRC